MKVYNMKSPNGRDEMIKKYGLEVVEDDERIWLKRGYKINYETGLLKTI